MTCVVKFEECAECAAKPGSPRLCDSCLNNRKVIESFKAHLHQSERDVKVKKKGTKQFRINQLRVDRIAVDSEPSRDAKSFTKKPSDYQDIVVTIIDKDGSRFEVKRITVQKDGLVGEDTSVAKLVVRRSWGAEGLEEEDDSVSCPLCLFQGHGAGACKAISS